MLHLYETKRVRRIAIVAALMTFATTGVALARQDGVFPGLPAANGGNGSVQDNLGNGSQGLQPLLQRAAQFQQAASIRGNTGPTGARISYSAASQAFGDLLRTLGGARSTDPAGASMPAVSSEQAMNDVRMLKSAARQAKTAPEQDKLNKAASFYATGAKEYLTAQLREALLEADTAAPVVLRGNAREADAATRAATQPLPQKPAPTAPNPNPVPKPNPAPVPPNPNPPVPPNPAPAPPDPTVPVPSDPNAPAPNPPAPNDPNAPAPVPPTR